MSHRVSNHHRHRLAMPDVRALLRLSNDLHAAAAAALAHAARGGTNGGGGPHADPKEILLRGARELTGAEHASAALATLAGPGAPAPPNILWSAHTGAAPGDVPDPEGVG